MPTDERIEKLIRTHISLWEGDEITNAEWSEWKKENHETYVFLVSLCVGAKEL